MKRNQTIVECDRCGATKVLSHTLPSELATLPDGWRQFMHPDEHRGGLLTFDADYCASLWFGEYVRTAWEPAPLVADPAVQSADGDPAGHGDPVPAAVVNDDISF